MEGNEMEQKNSGKGVGGLRYKSPFSCTPYKILDKTLPIAKCFGNHLTSPIKNLALCHWLQDAQKI